MELNHGPSEMTHDSGPATSYHRLSTKAECSGPWNTSSDNSLKKKSAKEGKDCIYPIREDQIQEVKGKRKDHDVTICNGTCQLWLHRGCAGLSRKPSKPRSTLKESSTARIVISTFLKRLWKI